MKKLCSVSLAIFWGFNLNAQVSYQEQSTPFSDEQNKEPLAYLRIFIPIEGDKNAETALGEVKPLPYPLQVKLKAPESEEIYLVSNAYSFFFTSYRPVPPGNYEVFLTWGTNLTSKKPLKIAKDDFYTFVVYEDGGRPVLEVLEDKSWETNVDGQKTVSKHPRLRVCDLIGSDSKIVSEGLKINSKITRQATSIKIQNTGIHTIKVEGAINKKPFFAVLEADFKEFPKQSLFIIKDLYDRPTALVVPDAVEP